MRRILSLLPLLVLACGPKPKVDPGPGLPPPDRASKLKSDILAAAPPRGCKKASECKATGLGYNACGGPRMHIVYCSTATDEAALRTRLEELEKVEKEEASKKADPPPCKKAPAPEVELHEGACRAKL